MGKRLKITFDSDVPQSQRFEIEQKFESAGWLAGGHLKSSGMPPTHFYDYIEAYWTSRSDAPIPDCPPWCHMEEIV